jgi:hypothetical protein
VLIPGFVLAGAGIGLVNPPLASAAIGVVPPARSGMASGINNTFRQVGIATGIAGLGAIFQHSITQNSKTALAASGHAREIAAAAHGHLAAALQSGAVSGLARALPGPARQALEHAYRVAFTDSLGELLVIGGVIALIGSVLAYALVRSRDFVATGEHAAAAEPEAAGALAG